MSEENKEIEEESWSKKLVSRYVDMYNEIELRRNLEEIENIDYYVDLLGEDLPHANEIIKKIMYNMKRNERNAKNRKK